MPVTRDEWIVRRVDAALKASPAGKPVAGTIKGQLNGLMRERALRSGELAQLANDFLLAPNEPPVEESAK